MEQAKKDPVGLAVEVFNAMTPTSSLDPKERMETAVRLVKQAQKAVEDSNTSNTELCATDKQKRAMTNMKIDFEAEISKEEAKKLISDKIASFS